MLKKPRPLPSRFNRPVNPATRRLAERRHVRHRQFSAQKWKRKWSQTRDSIVASWEFVVRFGAWIAGFCVLVVIGILLFSPALQVREIRVSRADPRVDIEQVQRALAPLFGERLMFVATTDVIPLLRAAMPDLDTAEIHKSYPSTLAVTLHPSPIIAQMKIDAADKSGSGVVLNDYLTQDGMYVQYAAQQVVTGTGILMLKLVDWGAKPVPWTHLLDPSFLDTMRSAQETLAKEFNLKPSERIVYLRAREFHLKVGSIELWFDLRSTVAEQIDRYRLYLKTSQGKAKQYVDLRLRDKIVYK